MLLSRKKILIVDDEAGIRDSLRLLLKQNFDIATAIDGEDALRKVDEETPDLILMDLMMPRMDGIEALHELKRRGIQIPVVMLTAANTVRSAVEAMKLGANDYLNKPFDIDALTSLIVELLEKSGDDGTGETQGEQDKPSQTEKDWDAYRTIVGSSSGMSTVLDQVRHIAEKDTTVLITGESGTGKELIAREIHRLSKRKDKPFVALNCAAIPETLIESELFGHEKGSFTSAVDTHPGHFELANGGTLFLDEIGELTLPVQVKLLRFLQDHEFYRIGRSKPIHVDVRLITATNRNLDELIREKRFRQDLYYRIHVVNLLLPPLRDRYEDIPILCSHFIEKLSPQYDNRQITVSGEAMDLMIQYSWPGNVRELENLIESLMALCQGDEVLPRDLPSKLHPRQGGGEGRRSSVFDGSLRFEDAERIFETEMIMKALKKTNYVQTKAAELLGISRRILKYKMDKLGIAEPQQAEAQQSGAEDEAK